VSGWQKITKSRRKFRTFHIYGIPGPNWQALLHLANHGTDHRSTVLEHLHALGVPTFDQDLILWLWGKK